MPLISDWTHNARKIGSHGSKEEFKSLLIKKSGIIKVGFFYIKSSQYNDEFPESTKNICLDVLLFFMVQVLYLTNQLECKKISKIF